MAKIKSNINVVSHWWNHGTKKLDFSGNIVDCLEDKSIVVKQKMVAGWGEKKKGFEFTTPHNVKVVHLDFNDGAMLAIKLWYATMGDKATVDFSGRIFTVNHNR